MSCLCYCIGHLKPQFPGTLQGVGGRQVYQVSHRRLSAAISRIGPTDLPPDLVQFRAFARVVRSYHRQGAIIPMRYGCVVSQESQVIKLLAEHDRPYEALLQELEGCEEMGLRVLLPAGSLGAGSGGGREVAGPAAADRLGRAYLTARKAHYAHQDRWTREYHQAAERCLTHFMGLFAKSKIEGPTPRLPLLSLYFLVPRPTVEVFRQAFRRLSETESARLLLSGPWPPYNFVTGGPSLI
jgi:hypothetical protein